MSVPITVRHGGRDLAGAVRERESWDEAARRVAATLMGDPVAEDLSGETKVFAVDSDQRVALRAMTRGDLGDVIRWRRSAHVHKWWASDGDPTPERITEQYAPSIDGMTPTRMWVAEVNGRSVGFVQDYRLSDYPEYALLTPDPGAIGVDYAIGEEAWLRRGVGSRILWAWLHRTRGRFPDATTCFAAPDHRNQASLRVLAKVGFSEGIWFDEPGDDGTVATVVGCSLDLPTVVGAGRGT